MLQARRCHPRLRDCPPRWSSSPTTGRPRARTTTTPGPPPSSTITAANVGDLEEVWRAELPEAGALSTVPLVAGRHRLRPGRHPARSSPSTGRPARSSGPASRPASTSGRSGWPWATGGSTAWTARPASSPSTSPAASRSGPPTSPPPTRPGVDIQPVVADGLVIASSVPISIGGIYAPGDRGVVSALDAATGEVRWSFDTVDGDLWGHPEVNSGGGAWYPPVVDLERRTGLRRRGQPGAVPRHRRVAQRHQPAGRQPLHGLDRGPRPRHRRAGAGSTR